MVRVVQLCGDPDILPFGRLGVAEHFFEGLSNLIMVAVGISTVNVPVANLQSVLYGLLNLICRDGKSC